METKKIALACFIGGVICSAIALLFSPNFWWLGMIAGFIGGYVSYEFREVCVAIPVAIENARYNLSEGWRIASLLSAEIKTFALKPHPFALCWFGVNAAFWGLLYAAGKWHWEIIHFGSASIIFVLTGVYVCLPITLILFALPAWFGYSEEGWGGHWVTDPVLVSSQRPLLTYKNAFRWIGIAYLRMAVFFLWGLWKDIAIKVWFLLRFTIRFPWELFKLIHSDKRLLCGVDGTLGGLISYLWLTPSTVTMGGHITLVLFGGLLGAGFGILNWEIVSKRILHVGNQES